MEMVYVVELVSWVDEILDAEQRMHGVGMRSRFCEDTLPSGETLSVSHEFHCSEPARFSAEHASVDIPHDQRASVMHNHACEGKALGSDTTYDFA